MQDVKIFDSELTPIEIGILAEVGSVQSFTTGSQPTPPLVQVRPASNITDSNATLHYELLSYDEAQPEIIMYWGPVDRSDNADGGKIIKVLDREVPVREIFRSVGLCQEIQSSIVFKQKGLPTVIGQMNMDKSGWLHFQRYPVCLQMK